MTAAIALGIPMLSNAQIIISGKITGGSGSLPLVGASIKVEHVASVSSGKNGTYKISVPRPGKYVFAVSYIGYSAKLDTLSVSAPSKVDFALAQESIVTDIVFVRSTRTDNKAVSTSKIIEKDDVERANFGQDLPFLIANTPGIVVTSDAGTGVGYTGIRIRGSDATRVNVTINGIPYNDSESQGTFWVNMPDFASSIQNIQIQRGVGTSTNGAGAFGGSLNILTNGPSTKSFAEVNSSWGSFNTIKNTVQLGTGLINERFSFEGRLSRIASDGFIDRSKSNLRSFFASGSYQNARNLLRMNVFSGSERTYQAWNGVPESRLKGDVAGMNEYISRNGLNKQDAENLLQSGNRTYNSFLYKDQTDNYTQTHYQLLYASQLSDQFTINGALHYTRGLGYYEEAKDDQKLKNYGLSPVIIGGTTISRTNLVRRRWLDNDFYGITYALTYHWPTMNITVGGAANNYSGDHFGQVIYADFGSDGNNSRHYYDNTGRKSDINFYGKMNIWAVKNLNIYADVQYRHVGYEVLGTDKNLNMLSIHAPLAFVNPKIGLSYTLTDQQHAYASFSVAHKEPGRDDYINMNPGVFPQPERLDDIEIGYQFKSSAARLVLNGYLMNYKNQLVVTGKINDVGEYFRQNVPESYRMGIELDGGYRFSQDFSMNVNAAISRNKLRNFTEFTDDYDNGGQTVETFKRPDISFSPNFIAGAELVFTGVENLSMSLQNRMVGRQYLDNTENKDRSLHAYSLTNATLGYDFKLRGVTSIQLGLQVNNLFNEKYESNGYTFGYISGGQRTTENFYFPQAGTHLMLRLNLRF